MPRDFSRGEGTIAFGANRSENAKTSLKSWFSALSRSSFRRGMVQTLRGLTIPPSFPSPLEGLSGQEVNDSRGRRFVTLTAPGPRLDLGDGEAYCLGFGAGLGLDAV